MTGISLSEQEPSNAAYDGLSRIASEYGRYLRFGTQSARVP